MEFSFHGRVKRDKRGRESKLTHVKESVSSNGITTYTTSLWDDGQYSCNCLGWATKKAGKERTCKHVKASQACNNSDMHSIDRIHANYAPGPVIKTSEERALRGIRFV